MNVLFSRNTCRVFYQTKYNLGASANVCNMLVYSISIVGSIVFGAIIDRIGRNAQVRFNCAILITTKCMQMIVLSAALGVLAHLTLTVTHLTPFVPVVTLDVISSLHFMSFSRCSASATQFSLRRCGRALRLSCRDAFLAQRSALLPLCRIWLAQTRQLYRIRQSPGLRTTFPRVRRTTRLLWLRVGATGLPLLHE